MDRHRQPTARSPHTPGKCEFGQGLYTAQMQLVAEELCVPVRARAPDSVRHVDDAGSGNDVGPAVASGELQSGEPGAGRGHGTRNPGAPGVGAAGSAAVRISSREDGAVSVRADAVAAGRLRRPRRRTTIRGPARSARRRAGILASGQVLGTSVPRVDMRAMVTGQFEFVHNVRVPGHAARARGAAAFTGRDGGERGRELGAWHARAS